MQDIEIGGSGGLLMELSGTLVVTPSGDELEPGCIVFGY